MCPPPKERDPPKGQQKDPPKEHQDLLDSLAMKDVPKPTDPKDIYQKFLNMLGDWPGAQNPGPTLEPENLTVGDPPIPPGRANPPQPPSHANPPANPGVPAGSDWEPGKIPMSEEEPKKLFSYRNPLYNKPSVPPPKISDPILPIPHRGQMAGGEGSQRGDLNGSGGVPPSWADNPPLDHSQGDPSMEKVPEQETPSQEVAKPSKNVLCPSRLPRKSLKFTDGKHTMLDPSGCPIGSLRLTDVVKSEKSSAPRSSKCKEPDTPDLGSEGALAPVWKRVKFEGATFCHGSTPSIHVGASLHEVEEKDEDNNGEKGEGYEDDDSLLEDIPKDNAEEGEDEDEDIQVTESKPAPSKHWTQSQQAQQDEQESSLVREILSDDEKLQKSQEEAEKASKEKASAPSTSDQQDPLGEGSGSVSGELDHQEPGKEGDKELTVKEVSFAKLNTKDKILMKALSEAQDLCYQ